jgi:hypothetical protein
MISDRSVSDFLFCSDHTKCYYVQNGYDSVCIAKADLGASAAVVMLSFRPCTRRLTKSVLDETFEVSTAVLLNIEVF